MSDDQKKSSADRAVREREEAISRLLSALPYLRYAAEKAKEIGKPALSIISKAPAGGGKVVASFDISFLDDVAAAIGAPPDTEEQEAKAAALEFLDTHGLAVRGRDE